MKQKDFYLLKIHPILNYFIIMNNFNLVNYLCSHSFSLLMANQILLDLRGFQVVILLFQIDYNFAFLIIYIIADGDDHCSWFNNNLSYFNFRFIIIYFIINLNYLKSNCVKLLRFSIVKYFIQILMYPLVVNCFNIFKF